MLPRVISFNEAGGFLPRKRVDLRLRETPRRSASMRPEDFSPGNPLSVPCTPPRAPGFNEAGGFLPRKPARPAAPARPAPPRFNEAGGFLPRKHICSGYSNINDVKLQ